MPIRVTAPTIINWVSGSAREVSQIPPSRAIPYTPV
uniref:Uncharacterized protein n=1 Tax=Rhizophora mucronata TaxID=61149 RepID=A0A2P2R085_RHIMU